MNSQVAAARPVLLACVLVFVLAVFLPCLGFDFVTWDDPVYVTENPLVRSLSAANLAATFSSFISGNYHPLPILSYALEFRLFGLDPRAFHAVNLALHLANTLLVFALLTALGGRSWTAAAAALLFAVHPQRVESVAWVADRKDLLAALFFLGSVLGYLSFARTRRAAPYLLALAAAALSLLSKATAVSLPLVLLLCDYLQGRRIDRRCLGEKVPFLALACVFGVIAVLARGSYEETLREQHFTLPAMAVLGGYRLVFYYLARLVAPFGHAALNPFYFDTTRILPSTTLVVVSAAVLLALAGLLLFSARRSRRVVFGSLFFLLTLAPVVPTVVLGQMADRFSYLPAVGAAFLVEAGLGWWAVTAAGRRGGILPIVAVVALLAATGSFLTRRDCAIWRDSESLWSDAIRTYPAVAGFHNHLGLVRYAKGETAAALASFERALTLDPGHLDAYLNRGIIRARGGDTRGAISDFERALQLEPANARAHNNLGNAYASAGDDERALAHLDAALASDPRLAEALFSRGSLRARQRDYPRAIADLTAAIATKPEYSEAFKGRSVVYDLLGDQNRALADISRAIALNPAVPEYYASRAIVLINLRRYDLARQDVRRLREMGRPIDPLLLLVLSRNEP